MNTHLQVNSRTRRRAIWMLVLTCALWGGSFPIVKALAAIHARVDPGASGLLTNASVIWPRFALAALLALPLAWRQLRAGVTRQEIAQAGGLTFFLSAGLLFQVDGLRFTAASTSSFLTQGYVLVLPIWVYGRARQWPPISFFAATALVFPGVAILAGVSWDDLRLGRGEIETIIAAMFFAGQILWLARPDFCTNRAMPMTFLMFVFTALVFLVLGAGAAIGGGQDLAAVVAPFSSGSWLFLTLLLSVICTFGAFTLMNIWQRWVRATEAGLIYTMEPVFTAVLVLFLPALFATIADISYENEQLTWRLVVGGLLVCSANTIIQLTASGPVAENTEPTQA